MRHLGGLGGVLFAMVIVGRPAAANAQQDADEEASAAFENGLTALEESRFRDAAQQFEASSQLRLNGPALFAAAKAWSAEGERARAADNYAAAIAAGDLRPAELEYAQRTLTDLDNDMALLELTGGGDVKLVMDGRRIGPPALVRIEPGQHTLLVSDGEHHESVEISLEAGERATLELALTDEVDPMPVRPPEPKANARVVEVEPEHPLRQVGVYGLIGTGVAAGFSFGYGAAALSAKSDFESDPSRENFDQASKLETATNVLIVVTSVLGAASSTLFVIDLLTTPASNADSSEGGDAGADDAQTHRIWMGIGLGGASVQGRF